MTPKFYPGTGRSPRCDWSTKENAKRLAMVIAKAWKSCGHEVKISVVRTVNHDERGAIITAYYGVTSDLVNGLPRNYRRLH